MKLLLAIMFFALPSVALAQKEICKQQESYKNTTTIILLDRTTKLSPTSKDMFLKGVYVALLSKYVAGRLLVYEVRANDFETTLIMSDCLIDYKKDYDAEAGHPGAGDASKEAEHFTDRILKKLFPDNAAGNSLEKLEKKERVIAYNNKVRRSREKSLTTIKTYIDTNITETKKTTIITELARILHENISDNSTIRLLVFSDLEDSRLTPFLKKKERNWKEAGIAEGNRLRGLYPVSSRVKSLQVIFWGVGRDEASPTVTLTPEDLDHLKVYWTACLQTLTGDTGSRVTPVFRCEFPSERFD